MLTITCRSGLRICLCMPSVWYIASMSFGVGLLICFHDNCYMRLWVIILVVNLS